MVRWKVVICLALNLPANDDDNFLMSPFGVLGHFTRVPRLYLSLHVTFYHRPASNGSGFGYQESPLLRHVSTRALKFVSLFHCCPASVTGSFRSKMALRYSGRQVYLAGLGLTK